MTLKLNSIGLNKDPKETTVVSDGFLLNPNELVCKFI